MAAGGEVMHYPRIAGRVGEGVLPTFRYAYPGHRVLFTFARRFPNQFAQHVDGFGRIK